MPLSVDFLTVNSAMRRGFDLSTLNCSRPMIGRDLFVTRPKTQRIAVQRFCVTPCFPMERTGFKGFGAVARKSLLTSRAKAQTGMGQNGLTVTPRAI